MTSSAPVDDPVATCGIYNNPDDTRVVVCARDPSACNKRVCAANLATPAGKFLCLVYIALIVGIIVVGTIVDGEGTFDNNADKAQADDRGGDLGGGL